MPTRPNPETGRRGTIGFAAALGRSAPPALAVALLVDLAAFWLRQHVLAVDAAKTYLPAAADLVHGRSPYHLSDVAGGTVFASPPLAGFVFAPFLALPSSVADVVTATLALGAVLASLRLVGVRDRRCYLIATLSYPVVSEFQTANVSALLAVCAAAVWRYRDRPAVAGVAAGATVALKLLGWPLIVFLLVTRRFGAAAIAAASAIVGIVLPWAAVGFVGARGYPHLLSLLMHVQRGKAYSVGALLAPRVSWTSAELVTWAIVVALLAAAWKAARPQLAFAYCTAAAITSSPIVWPHYLILLLLPLAIVVPTFGYVWLRPLAFWLSPHAQAEHTWQVGIVIAAEVALVGVTAGRSRAERKARPPGAVDEPARSGNG